MTRGMDLTAGGSFMNEDVYHWGSGDESREGGEAKKLEFHDGSVSSCTRESKLLVRVLRKG